jgi:segregation and condensation protein B
MELNWIKIGRRRVSPGRPVTFAITQNFLDHFGLESARDLPGLKELKSAGLLESPPPPGSPAPEEILEGEDQQSELFNEEETI